MKNRNLKHLKSGLFAIALFGMAAVSAQATGDVARDAGTAVKVIDNKGTIKYFQSNNGITQIVNTTADVTTTTWQLGGALTTDTNISTGANEFKLTLAGGGTFVIDDIQASTLNADDGSDTGWTLLVRDETTNEVRNILASDLVDGIRVEYSQAADATANVDITVTGLPALTPATTMAKLFVFRNGAKLRPTADFTVTAGQVSILQSADLPMYAGDIIDIQYIK